MPLSRIVCLIFCLFSIVNLIANAELVGYWSFDKADGVDDLTGNGHDGVIHGNPKVIVGTLEGEMPGADAVHITEGLPFTIGSRNGQNHFDGAVDEVAFWNEAIAVEESMDPLPVRPGRKLTTAWGAIKARK